MTRKGVERVKVSEMRPPTAMKRIGGEWGLGTRDRVKGETGEEEGDERE